MDSLSIALKRKRDAEERLRRSDPAKNIIIGEDGAGGQTSSNPSEALTAAVESLNTLTGDVTLAAGTNIALTQSGNTITIDAAGGGGGSAGWDYGSITESAGSALDEDWGDLT